MADVALEVVAVDNSQVMIDRAKSKSHRQNLTYVLGDICSIHLHQTFDLIIAPFRVFKALETSSQVAGIMRVIREHLKKDAVAVLNVFKPKYTKEEIAKTWCQKSEVHYYDLTAPNGDVLKVSDLRERIDTTNQVMYPVLIYRRYRDGTLFDEHRNPICMKYYYPDEFKKIIQDFGFKITRSWGGYRGESYGPGSELVIEFTL